MTMLALKPEALRLVPIYRFRLSKDNSPRQAAQLDLDDELMARSVAKFVGRQLASRDLQWGVLVVDQNIVVEDADGRCVHSQPLESAIALR